jgi:hypothetical protein
MQIFVLHPRKIPAMKIPASCFSEIPSHWLKKNDAGNHGEGEWLKKSERRCASHLATAHMHAIGRLNASGL